MLKFSIRTSNVNESRHLVNGYLRQAWLDGLDEPQ